VIAYKNEQIASAQYYIITYLTYILFIFIIILKSKKMTIFKSLTIVAVTILFTACGSTKKSSTPILTLLPGETQLTAIKTKYPDATAFQLNEGYSIYTGACTNCHGQKNIFNRSEASWLHEIDDMSPKANLTAAQKDALTKYILSMKAAAVTGN